MISTDRPTPQTATYADPAKPVSGNEEIIPFCEVSEIGGQADGDDGVFRSLGHSHQRRNDAVACEWLRLGAEAYLKCGLKFCFLLKLSGGSSPFPLDGPTGEFNRMSNDFVALVIESDSSTSACVEGRIWPNLENLVALKNNRSYGGGYEPMFVFQVERVDREQICAIPSRVRLQTGYLSNDLFAGEIYLGAGHSAYKGVTFLRERKLDAFMLNLRDDGGQNSINQDIEGASKIVGSVTNGERNLDWEGEACFDNQGLFIGFRVLASNEFERTLGEIGFNLPTHVVDVMLGPRNL